MSFLLPKELTQTWRIHFNTALYLCNAVTPLHQLCQRGPYRSCSHCWAPAAMSHYTSGNWQTQNYEQQAWNKPEVSYCCINLSFRVCPLSISGLLGWVLTCFASRRQPMGTLVTTSLASFQKVARNKRLPLIRVFFRHVESDHPLPEPGGQPTVTSYKTIAQGN